MMLGGSRERPTESEITRILPEGLNIGSLWLHFYFSVVSQLVNLGPFFKQYTSSARLVMEGK